MGGNRLFKKHIIPRKILLLIMVSFVFLSKAIISEHIIIPFTEERIHYFSLNYSDIFKNNPIFNNLNNKTNFFLERLLTTDGQPISKCDFLYWDGKDIHLKYDILNDLNNMTIIATVNDFPMHSPYAFWKSNGGPTITKGPDNIWYVITRYRIGEQFNNTWGRGHYYGCFKSNNLHNWERIWLVNRTNITGELYTTYSFEQCTLRFFNNSWYFYFTSPLNSSYNWSTIWVNALTIEKIYTKVMNQKYWHVVDKKTPGYDRWKGSWFGYDEEYYWTPGHGNGSQSIKKNDYPELNIWETSSSYTGCGNARIIFFDIQSQKYITWGHKKVGSDIVWCYCVFSDKLKTLESRINHTIISNTSTYGGNARHVDYYCFAPYSYVIIMAYDYDKDGNEETCLWDYRTIDEKPPTVQIAKPSKGLYFFNLKLGRFLLQKPIIIGKIKVKVNATDNISSIKCVKFYIDNILKSNDTFPPYTWTWDTEIFSRFKRIITVEAYDNAGNNACDEIKVWKIL